MVNDSWQLPTVFRLLTHKNNPLLFLNFIFLYSMKTTLKFLIGIILISLISCKPSPRKAQDYYSEITKPIESVLMREDQLIQQINLMMKDSSETSSVLKKQEKSKEVQDFKPLDMAFNNFQLQIATSMNQMKAIGTFDNSNDLKDAATGMLTEYKSVSENEYPALIAIVKIPDDKYTNENDTKFFEISDNIDSKLQKKIGLYIEHVKLFTQKYNFKLENDSLK